MAGTIVTGFDGTEGSARALEQAISNTKFVEGHLVVVIVAETAFDPLGPSAGSYADFVPDPNTGALRKLVAANQAPPVLQGFVTEAKQRLDAAGVNAEIVTRIGDPAREIADVAQAHEATKIVLGSHRHRLFGGLISEDVAATIGRESSIEVVVVA